MAAVAAGAVVAAGHTLTDDAPAGHGGAVPSDAIALASGQGPALPDSGTGSTGPIVAAADGDDALAGAAADAANTVTDAADAASDAVDTVAQGVRDAIGQGPQVLEVAPQVQRAADVAQQLIKGAQYAAQKAAAEALARRPLYVKPAAGRLSSHYGSRWGTVHGGVDIANAMGTPIYAATDGEVISAGPASGFGQWIRVRADDGTVTVYGHIRTIEVQVGQRVTAGDEIAKMGSRGFSTGPHLHFEVWRDGTQRIDPQPWLAERGISLTHY